jgi:hypothetical protein
MHALFCRSSSISTAGILEELLASGDGFPPRALPHKSFGRNTFLCFMHMTLLIYTRAGPETMRRTETTIGGPKLTRT